jgi:hypothetical protein
MPAIYTDEDFERMEHDPVLARCYLWQVAMNLRLLARERRRAVRAQAVNSSFVAFDEFTDEARDELNWADTEERVASVTLDNIDDIVKSRTTGGK